MNDIIITNFITNNIVIERISKGDFYKNAISYDIQTYLPIIILCIIILIALIIVSLLNRHAIGSIVKQNKLIRDNYIFLIVENNIKEILEDISNVSINLKTKIIKKEFLKKYDMKDMILTYSNLISKININVFSILKLYNRNNNLCNYINGIKNNLENILKNDKIFQNREFQQLMSVYFMHIKYFFEILTTTLHVGYDIEKNEVELDKEYLYIKGIYQKIFIYIDKKNKEKGLKKFIGKIMK